MTATNPLDILHTASARTKAGREAIAAAALIAVGVRHGATIARRNEEPNPGWRGAGVTLEFTLSGVFGAQHCIGRNELSLFSELEPKALSDYDLSVAEPPNALLQASIAISLRRIAEALARRRRGTQTSTGDNTT